MYCKEKDVSPLVKIGASCLTAIGTPRTFINEIESELCLREPNCYDWFDDTYITNSPSYSGIRHSLLSYNNHTPFLAEEICCNPYFGGSSCPC